MTLPHYRFHPDPIKTGAIVSQKIVCECCNQPVEYNYVGPFYSDREVDSLCPTCIANGLAATKFHGEFLSGDDFESEVGDVGSEETIKELIQRTPGFLAAQQAKWLSLNGLPGAYEGDFNRQNAWFMNEEFWQKVKEITETWRAYP